MSMAERWLLPDGVREVLPREARRVEQLRRQLLDLFDCWGYDLVMPPLVEYLESLLTGTGNDLALSTFKVTDQLTGRLMGIRADTTPQVARIDAHSLGRREPTRLCYANSVLHTVPGVQSGRSPLQIGAELYGHAGVESDLEVICLMLETLAAAGVRAPTLDLGHVGVYRTLVAELDLSEEARLELFELLQAKSMTELDLFLGRLPLAESDRQRLVQLSRLNGDRAILKAARSSLGNGVRSALDELEHIAAQVMQRYPNVSLYFDLAELRGYNYHTGLVFATYVPGQGQAVAKGGRYDEIGRVFGRARAATGFSADLRVLAGLQSGGAGRQPGILAPAGTEPALLDTILRLRAKGERVVQTLPGTTANGPALGCDRELRQDAESGWQICALDAQTST